MESYLASGHYDLVTPDGTIVQIHHRSENELLATVVIDDISPAFLGFDLDQKYVQFNIKSTLAQLGLNGIGKKYMLERKDMRAQIQVEFRPVSILGKKILPLLQTGCYVGKLFAVDPGRRVRDPDYLLRMFHRKDRNGLPLLSLGQKDEKSLHLEKIEGRTIARLSLKQGTIGYDDQIEHFLPTIIAALKYPKYKTRELLSLHQIWQPKSPRTVQDHNLLLVRTSPLHIRTVFARVSEELLPKGFHHTTASVLQPDTKASGDVYELYGNSEDEITEIPLEFFTLEPHREHVFFTDRDQLQTSLEDPNDIFKAFATAPSDPAYRTAVFIVKGEQMLKLSEKDWIARKVQSEHFPGLYDLARQAQMVQEYIQTQPSYPFLKAIESGLITSQGVLFSRYFPSPLMKKMLLGDIVQTSLKGIYFEQPSQTHGKYFSHEDRSTLLDLAKFAIPVFWADKSCGKILQYAPKPDKDTGMFVPRDKVDDFIKSTIFGVYGSTLIELIFEEELEKILAGILDLQKQTNHPLLNHQRPLSLITGGGPGVMEVGNRVAKKLNILSCANIVDFSGIEQEENPYIDAKMTYRLDKLIERQGEFNLDFPIFLIGGFGTDFEFALEQVRRKVGIGIPTPVLLLGPRDYFRDKITPHFKRNLLTGTIAGSEWVSNCFYCAETAEGALKVYRDYFSGKLPIGEDFPPAPEGFFFS